MSMKKAVFAALPLVIACAALQAQSGNPWPTWRGPDRNGIVSDGAWDPKAIAKAPAWKIEVGQGYSSVCVAGGFVFTSGMKNTQTETVVCLDPGTGKTVWAFEHPSTYVEYSGSRGTPVYEDGRLYFMSIEAHAYCLDARTGKKIWDTDIAAKTGAWKPTWAFSSSALIEGTLVVFNVGKAGAALEKTTGKIVWKSGEDAAGYATPVAFDAGGRRCLAILGSKTLSVVEASTGKTIASTPWVTGYDCNIGDPVIVGSTIFVGTDYNTGCAVFRLDGAKLTRLWLNAAVLPHFCSAVYIDGYYYVNSGFAGQGMGEFYCLDARTGKVVWSKDLGVGSLIAAGGNLLISTEIGNLIVAKASPAGYTEIARATRVVPRLCWTAPVLAEGRIYLRSSGGTLVCLDVSQ